MCLILLTFFYYKFFGKIFFFLIFFFWFFFEKRRERSDMKRKSETVRLNKIRWGGWLLLINDIVLMCLILLIFFYYKFFGKIFFFWFFFFFLKRGGRGVIWRGRVSGIEEDSVRGKLLINDIVYFEPKRIPHPFLLKKPNQIKNTQQNSLNQLSLPHLTTQRTPSFPPSSSFIYLTDPLPYSLIKRLLHIFHSQHTLPPLLPSPPPSPPPSSQMP